MWPIPTITQLADHSGRPEATYSTAFANQALFQATLLLATLTERPDSAGLSDDEVSLANQGILAYADHLYLVHPYDAVVASPFSSENIGSYSYSKPSNSGSQRVLASAELKSEDTGVMWFDLAIRMLSLHQKIAGVASEAVTVFDDVFFVNDATGRRVIFGPADFDCEPIPFGISGENWPRDPGI